MDLKEIQKKQLSFLTERDWHKFHTVENLCKAIAIEAGELLELVQWESEINIDKEVPEIKKHFEEEIADILLYSLSLCNKISIDPVKIMKEKISSNEKKYPKDLFKGRYKL